MSSSCNAASIRARLGDDDRWGKFGETIKERKDPLWLRSLREVVCRGGLNREKPSCRHMIRLFTLESRIACSIAIKPKSHHETVRRHHYSFTIYSPTSQRVFGRETRELEPWWYGWRGSSGLFICPWFNVPPGPWILGPPPSPPLLSHCSYISKRHACHLVFWSMRARGA